MISKGAMVAQVLGISVFLETIFLVLFRAQVPASSIILALIIGLVATVYIFTGIAFAAWSNRGTPALRIQREVATRRLHTHEMNYIEVTVVNPTEKNLESVRVVDYYPESFQLMDGSNTITVTMPAYSKVTFSYVLKAQERGSYRIGPTEAYVSDTAGYVVDQKTFENGTKVVVYPPLQKHIQKRLKKPSEHLATGTKFSKTKGRGFDYVGSRKYIVGDEVKLIDWKFLAKTTEPGTKEFHIERNIDILLMIDTSESMNSTTGKETKLDSCADACSYVAYQFLKQGDSVGVLTAGPNGMQFVRPCCGRDAYHRIMSAIASIEGDRGSTDLAKYVRHALGKLSGRTLLFLFTDHRDAEELSRVASIVREAKHDILVVIPYIDSQHYGNTLFAREGKRHDPTYISSLAYVLFLEELMGLTSAAEHLKRLGIRCVVTSTDNMRRELLLTIGGGYGG